MKIDIKAAELFVLTHARLLERQRLAFSRSVDPRGVLTALFAYQNDDGGFGHALEPDVRAPNSETTATLNALELLADYDCLAHINAERALGWVGDVAHADGGIPFMLPASLPYPRAPWMEPGQTGSHLTFGFAAIGRRANFGASWVGTATDWCWATLNEPDKVTGYTLKYALAFLDANADDARATPLLGTLSHFVGADGYVEVPGGTADEKLTPLALSPHPHLPSRRLFTSQQIQTDLDRLASEQQADGGWTFDWLEWCPAQGLEWRGIQTVQALSVLREHGYSKD